MRVAFSVASTGRGLGFIFKQGDTFLLWAFQLEKVSAILFSAMSVFPLKVFKC